MPSTAVRRWTQSATAAGWRPSPLQSRARKLDKCSAAHNLVRHAQISDLPHILKIDEACFCANLRSSEQSLRVTPPHPPLPYSPCVPDLAMSARAEAASHAVNLSGQQLTKRRTCPLRRCAGRFRQDFLHDHGGRGRAWCHRWVHIGLASSGRAAAAESRGSSSAPAAGHRQATADRAAR